MQTDLQTNPAAGAFQPFASSMTVHYLADGDSGAHQCIDDMRGLVDRALKSPQIYQLARHLVANVAPYDERGELEALYDWALQNIRFTKGVIGKQSLQSADTTVALGAGQCTDLSILLAALAMSIGYPARFVAVATDPQAPDQFSHIYPEVQIDDDWLPMDAARPGAQFALPPARVYRSEMFPILDSVGNMPRLGDDSTTAADIASVIQATGQSAAQIIAASQGPYVLVNGQYVANPNYPGAVPVLQNTSQALGVPSIVLLGVGVWLLYTVLKR
jgi:hypothetical protein